jgi:hypothetical protein
VFARRGEACWWPEPLPGTRMLLCTVNTAAGGLDSASIAILDPSVETGRPRADLFVRPRGRLLGSLPEGQAPDMGLHNGVLRE